MARVCMRLLFMQIFGRVFVMNLDTVVEILNSRLDELIKNIEWSQNGKYFLVPYRQSEKLIQACGHETTELHEKINAAEVSLGELEEARKKAVCKFKSEGVCFVVDEARRKENEASRLQ